MIIRPASGTGNKVIVQDQAGAAVLTTADSGASLTAPTIANMTNCTFPAGHILQVVSTTKGDTWSSGATTAWADVTGLTATITPASTSNKIYFSFAVSFSGESNSYPAFKVYRDSTSIWQPTETGTGLEVAGGNLFEDATAQHGTNREE